MENRGRQGLYESSFEHDACGVGFICHMKGAASHRVVSDALLMLENMAHRGACGTSPDKLHLVSIRTDNEFLRMVPSEALNEIIGGVFAYYQHLHGVLIFALSVISNHYHLVAKAPRGNLWEFAQDVNRELAKRLNRYLNRRGHFWGRRYDDLIILELDDALEGFLYALTNPVHHGLVSHPRLWPGVSSYWQALGVKERSYRFTNWTAYGEAKRRAADGQVIRLSDYQTSHVLRISVLPQLEHLSAAERTEHVRKLIDNKRAEIHVERLAEGKTSYLGRKNVLAQSPNERPAHTTRKKRPWFYTKNPQARRAALKEEKLRRELYHEASVKFRAGDYSVKFPDCCLLPPGHHKPKPPKVEANVMAA